MSLIFKMDILKSRLDVSLLGQIMKENVQKLPVLVSVIGIEEGMGFSWCITKVVVIPLSLLL